VKISVVIPVFNSELTVADLVKSLQSQPVTEIVLVNDGSTDNSKLICFNLSKAYKNVIYVELFKNFGQLSAISAGLKIATGNYVVVMDDDFQHDPTQIQNLIEKIQEGFDFVFGISENLVHTRRRTIGSRINRAIMEWAYNQPKGIRVTSFYVVTQALAKFIADYEGPYPYISGRIFSLSHNGANTQVNMKSRPIGKSNYTLLRLLKLTLNGIFNFSLKPLRTGIFVGLALSGTAFLAGVSVFSSHLFGNKHIPSGWTSLILCILFLSGIQIIFLGLIGEYIGRIFLVQGKFPQYGIRFIHGGDEQ